MVESLLIILLIVVLLVVGFKVAMGCISLIAIIIVIYFILNLFS